MTVEVCLTDDPVRAVALAGPFLESRPVEHHLILRLLQQRIARPEPGCYWVVADGEDVLGMGFQSPVDYFVTVTPMPSDAVDALVERVVADGGGAPGVSGEAATAARFAGQWTEHHGTAAAPDMGLRVYALGELVTPLDVPGALRVAMPEDADVVLELVAGFHRDTREPSVGDDSVHLERIDGGFYFLWDDGGPRTLVGRTPTVAGMSCVYAVFTPPERRRRGYAGAAVAALSQLIRDDGADAMLFTDLGNPTSNSIYRRIGYRAVAENLRYRFSAPASAAG